MLYFNPNLAEGLPVIAAPFVVQWVNNELVLVNDPTDNINILNAGFEAVPVNSNFLPSWEGQDKPGTLTFWDNTVAHTGNASVRVANLARSQDGVARINQTFAVSPFRDYYVSVWVKTRSFLADKVQVLVRNSQDERGLQYNVIPVASTNDWTKYEFTFNTLESTSVDLFLGVWGGKFGNLWWDDLEIRPTTFNNIIRRPNTPVTITQANGNILREGVAIDSILDPLSGVDPFR